jgi:hypothetical protein
MSTRQVKCPRCGKLSEFSPANPFRPFCGERCKLIDLGAWAEGTYTIPVAPPAGEEGESPSEAEIEEALAAAGLTDEGSERGGNSDPTFLH